MTVLLARNRQPLPTVAAGVPHAELAAGLVSLPSGLLAMVCAAIVKFEVRLGAAGVRGGACRLHGPWERADEVPTRAQRLSESGRGLQLGSARMRSTIGTTSSSRMLFRFPTW